MTSSTRSSVRDERRDTLLLPLSVLQSVQFLLEQNKWIRAEGNEMVLLKLANAI